MLNYFSSTAPGFFSLWLPLRQLNSLRMCIDSNCLWMHSMHSHSTSTSIICTHTQTQLAHARTQALAIALSLSFSSSLVPYLSSAFGAFVLVGELESVNRLRVTQTRNLFHSMLCIIPFHSVWEKYFQLINWYWPLGDFPIALSA